MNDTLENLVDAWLTVPDLAERLGIDAGRVRRVLQERRLIGAKVGERAIFSVPAAFLVPAHLAEPSQSTARAAADDGAAVADDAPLAVLSSLHGTFTVLRDAGLTDEESIEWLFSADDSLGSTPIEALRTGRKTAVRRIAQTLA